MALDIDRLRRQREAKGLTQSQAAARAGLRGGRQAWNDIESGRRSNLTIATLEKVAEAIGVRAADLLTH